VVARAARGKEEALVAMLVAVEMEKANTEGVHREALEAGQKVADGLVVGMVVREP
jgi:hypothetical protein